MSPHQPQSQQSKHEHELSEFELAEFKQAFEEFDKDASGSISVDELLGLMRALGEQHNFLAPTGALSKNPTEEELLGLVMEVDIDGNGTIEFGEFIDLMRHNSLDVLDEEADLRMAFKMFDSNGDGYIDMKELKTVTMLLGTMLTKEELDDFMAEADADGNGKLDYDEFVKILVGPK